MRHGAKHRAPHRRRANATHRNGGYKTIGIYLTKLFANIILFLRNLEFEMEGSAS